MRAGLAMVGGSVSKTCRVPILLLGVGLLVATVEANSEEGVVAPLEQLRLFLSPEERDASASSAHTEEVLQPRGPAVERPEAELQEVERQPAGYAVVQGSGGVHTIVDDVPQSSIR